MSAASKVKTAWYCSNCGHREIKWTGRCAACGSWNSLSEEVEAALTPSRFASEEGSPPTRPVKLNEIKTSEQPRYRSDIEEFDRAVGGGLAVGSLTLLAGDPGIGKSTFLLQLSDALQSEKTKVLYVCGEESIEQTHSRASRLGLSGSELYFLHETQFSRIKAQVDSLQPQILIVDSIQIVYRPELPSAPGSVTQVRETTMELMHLAKRRNLTILLVGHVTKSGEIAGPRVLEHLVDTVLYFEGDRHQDFRILRAVKNRFGPTDEIALFRMGAHGLEEVANPSEILIEGRSTQTAGSIIIPSLEGTRPILVEVQALVTPTTYPNPSRRCTGLDQNRVALLLAVLEKRLKYRLHSCDVFVSLAGGIKILEPSLDLGTVLAIASSFCNQSIPPNVVAIGEVGLAGEIRGVNKIETRLKEVARLGFERALIPRKNRKAVSDEIAGQVEIIGIDQLEEAIEHVVRD